MKTAEKISCDNVELDRDVLFKRMLEYLRFYVVCSGQVILFKCKGKVGSFESFVFDNCGNFIIINKNDSNAKISKLLTIEKFTIIVNGDEKPALTLIQNPFFRKCLEEVQIILDLEGI